MFGGYQSQLHSFLPIADNDHSIDDEVLILLLINYIVAEKCSLNTYMNSEMLTLEFVLSFLFGFRPSGNANATDPSLKKHGEDPGIVKLYVVNSSCESNLLVPNNIK